MPLAAGKTINLLSGGVEIFFSAPLNLKEKIKHPI
jgi:hypothetical protein